MNVIGEWKTMLGSDWDKTYAASNTIMWHGKTTSRPAAADRDDLIHDHA